MISRLRSIADREVEVDGVREQVVTTAQERFGLAPDHTIELIERAERDAGDVAALFL